MLDLSRVRAGPNCVRMLTDFGADVVRVEPPPGVDPNEAMFAANRQGGDFQNINRNKRSMTLNLKKPGAIDILLRMVKDADVVVENWRPDVKRKLGLDYASLAAVNPRIILASISGFGQDGPYAWRPGFDQIIQGMGGLMSVTGHAESGPVRAGLAVADMSAGLYTALGILTALMDFQVARYLNDQDVPVQVGNNHPTSSPMGLFEASDGVFNLGASGEGNWVRLCKLVGRPEWLTDAEFLDEPLRVKHRARLNSGLADIFRHNTVAAWVASLNEAGVPAGPVYTVPQVMEDEQVQHLGVTASLMTNFGKEMQYITQPVTLERTPATVVAPAPDWGEHTDEVLGEAGYTPDEIRQFHADGVV